MKNLYRALGMALRYRWSLICSMICSLMVALFWGANLGAVYPFIEVVLHDKSLHDWSAETISETESEIEKRRTELDGIGRNPKPIDAKHSNRLNGEIRSLERNLWLSQTIAPWIDTYAPKDPFNTLKMIVVFMLIGTLLRCGFLATNMFLVARIGQRTILDLQNLVFNNVLNMEMSEIGVKGTGDLINRIRGETNSIGNAITTLFGKTIREPQKMAACLLGAAIVNWRLLLFSLVVCPAAVAIMIGLARMTKKANKKALEQSAKLLNRLYQALAYLRMVKSYNMQTHEAQRFQAVARHVYKKAMRISLLNALARTNNELLSVTVIGLSVLAGGYLVLNQQTHLFGIRMSVMPMDFGQIMLFFAFLIGSVDPLRKLGDVYNRVQGGVVAADRVFPIIDQLPKVVGPENGVELEGSERAIKFESVSFGYESAKPVLDSVSFDLPAGSSVAIVGQNGCGKSTMINLLPRFFDPDSGQIKINGYDLKSLDLNKLRNEISFVTQTTMLFGDSVFSNISYGVEDVGLDEVVAAAKFAHADSFIVELEDGYYSQIDEYGNNLSGGQRQRLSLARAILKDPKILVLDEATSQIDPESEQLIHQTLAEFIRGRTTLIVTHRMSTIELVDFVLIMKDGRIVDFGTHEQLLARCAAYQKLRQFELEEAA